eukprot:CAMPEP_0184747566 /NCGR_PEP_ID=MMETSP0315-20130426/12281_1 /TAXON_ID=101924 /ORGANISM="Rhodosorus marinus, Strain UTEX LB 2760" /LENGTH=78 /DNA_ID=CAMNT_0027220971 /DNA_START=129 /DNA_END=365 /DNA_ORIENTATION=+
MAFLLAVPSEASCSGWHGRKSTIARGGKSNLMTFNVRIQISPIRRPESEACEGARELKPVVDTPSEEGSKKEDPAKSY